MRHAQLDASANVPGTFVYSPAAGTMLAAGTYNLSVTFTPTDAVEYTTASKTVSITVNAGSTQTATTTAVTASAGMVNFNQTLTFTATVKASSGTATPTGSVEFYDATTATNLGSVTLAGGTATLTTATLPLGAQTITASYGGVSGTFGSSTNTTPLSVTVTVTGIPSAYILDPTAAGALTLSGNAQLQLAGLVDVDSTSTTSAINASGNAIVSGSAIQVHGKVLSSGNAHLSPAPVTTVAAFSDPYASLAVPTLPAISTSGMTSHGALTVTNTQTIQPGSYGQITVSGNANLTLSPGTYVIAGITISGNATVSIGAGNYAIASGVNISGNATVSFGAGNYVLGAFTASGNANITLGAGIYAIAGGGFSISGNTNITGSNVLLYNAGTNYPSAGGSFGNVTLSGNGNISLNPAASGTYAGILLFQSRDNTKVITLSGNGIVMPGGLLYAPAAPLAISGNGQFKGSLVVDSINISGNTILNTAAGDGQTVYDPAQIRAAYGVNNLPLDGTGQT